MAQDLQPAGAFFPACTTSADATQLLLFSVKRYLCFLTAQNARACANQGQGPNEDFSSHFCLLQPPQCLQYKKR